MKIHPLLVGIFLSAWLALQSWQLSEISALKVKVAELSTLLDYYTGNTKHHP